MKNLFTILALLSLALPAHAHHLWINQEDGNYTVNRGNILKGSQSYAPAAIKAIKAYGKAGNPIPVRRADAPDHAAFTTGETPALTTAVARWGYRVNTTRGKKLISPDQARAQGLKILSVFKSVQFSKALLHPSSAATAPLGMKFEIVPVTDPLAAGDRPAAFRLLFDGSPLPDQPVYTRDNKEIKTDEKGIFRVPVRDHGIYLFYSKHNRPAPNDPDLDHMKYMTFLTFEVKK